MDREVWWATAHRVTNSRTQLKRLYSVSASRVVSSAYLRLLVSLSAILIPVCDSSSLAFLMSRELKPAKNKGTQGEGRTNSIKNSQVMSC